MKKFIITEDEKRRILGLHEGFKKGVLSEQFTKVDGPYKNVTGNAITGDLYIMRLEKSMCRYKNDNFYMTPMTGTSCGENYVTIPGGKFYVQTSQDGQIRMLVADHKQYPIATNNGQGYDNIEDAKKGLTLVLNPDGYTGRHVQKGTTSDGKDYKVVAKYDKEGTIKSNKMKITSDDGYKQVGKKQSGL